MNKINPIYIAAMSAISIILAGLGTIIYFASQGEAWAIFATGIMVGSALPIFGQLVKLFDDSIVMKQKLKENLTMMMHVNKAMGLQNKAMTEQNKSLVGQPQNDTMPSNAISINNPVLSEWETQ